MVNEHFRLEPVKKESLEVTSKTTVSLFLHSIAIVTSRGLLCWPPLLYLKSVELNSHGFDNIPVKTLV